MNKKGQVRTVKGIDHRSLFQEFKNARTGILTNQSAFGYESNYHTEYYRKYLDLQTVFIPEHGLFAELQDQVSGSGLSYAGDGLNYINLYGDSEKSLFPDESVLKELDLILIDIRDTGARYYTFLTTCFYLLQAVSRINQSGESRKITVMVIDSPNPAGRKMEGTPLQPEYESFVGVPTVLHRHGLTPAELMNYYIHEFNLNIDLVAVLAGEIYKLDENESKWIPPSPNIPARSTCMVYAGQCLLEGTNLSEGRGTTRPFEIFGAAFIDYSDKSLLAELTRYQKGCFILRPLQFIPVFHKFAGEICGGYQLLVEDAEKFHSLLFSLHFIRTIKEFYPGQFSWRDGIYEFRSDYSAIKILAGDDRIIDFLEGRQSYENLEEIMRTEERAWAEKVSEFLLYP